MLAAPPGGYPYLGSDLTASFDLERADWDAPEHFAAFTGRGDLTACLCVKHPVSDDIYYSRNNGDGWYQWIAAQNRWQRLSGSTRSPWYCGAAIDPKSHRLGGGLEWLDLPGLPCLIKLQEDLERLGGGQG